MIESWEVWEVVCGRIGIREGPYADARRIDAALKSNEQFDVIEVVHAEDGQHYLKLRDGRGWVFARDPSFLGMVIAERVSGSKVVVTTHSFSIRFGKHVVVADQDLITHKCKNAWDAEIVNITHAVRENGDSRLLQFIDGSGYKFNGDLLEGEQGYMEWLVFNRAHACMLTSIGVWKDIGIILQNIDMFASRGRSSLNVLCRDAAHGEVIAAQLHARGFLILFPVRSMLAERARALYKCGKAPASGDVYNSIQQLLEHPPRDNDPEAVCVGSFKLLADVNLQSLEHSGEAYRFSNFSALWQVMIPAVSDNIKDENAFLQILWPELSQEPEVMRNSANLDIREGSVLQDANHRACTIRVLKGIVAKSYEGIAHINVLCKDLEQKAVIEEQMGSRGFDIGDPVKPMLAEKIQALLRLGMRPKNLAEELGCDQNLWKDHLLAKPPGDDHIFAKCAGSFKIVADVNLECFAESGRSFNFAKAVALPYSGVDTKDEQLLIKLSWDASTWGV